MARDRIARHSRNESVRLIAIIVACVLVVMMFILGAVRSEQTEPPGQSDAGESVPVVTPSKIPNVTDTEASLGTDSQAYSQIVHETDLGWAASQPLNGQWVAQLSINMVLSPNQPNARPSSKGTVDTPQVVLATFQSLDERLDSDTTQVHMLRRSSYGPAIDDEQFIFVTIALGDFQSSDDVEQWCQDSFPELGTGTELDASCSPLSLQPRQS